MKIVFNPAIKETPWEVRTTGNDELVARFVMLNDARTLIRFVNGEI